MSLARGTKTIVSTVECYDAWSNSYDSDGNVLQMLDDVAFKEIVQPLLESPTQNDTSPLCCELGCGTGRNTRKLLDAGWHVIAVDISTGMMAKAKERVSDTSSSVSWLVHDLNTDDEIPIDDSSVDAVISTLVMEHIAALDRFFKTIHRILKKNGNSWVFITAMHPDMYRVGSQAGFILDETTGAKVCGISFDHSIEQIIDAATNAKLTLTYVFERRVENEEHVQQLGSRANKWLGTNMHVSFLFHFHFQK